MAMHPLGNKNFVLLWAGNLISKVGDKFYTIAIAWWILQKTKSPVLMGLLMVTAVLPELIVGLYAGALIDRRPRKPFVIWPDILRGTVVLGLTGLTVAGKLEIWQVFAMAGLISLGTAFFDPAIQAVIPQLVDEAQLPKANALNQMAGGISTVLGPVIGGVAVSFLGFANVFLLNGLSYLIAAFLAGFIVLPPSPGGEAPAQSIRDDLQEGLRYLKGQPKVLIIMSVIGIAHFLIGSLFVTLPFLADSLSGSGVRNLGNLEAMLGMGMVVGTCYINLKQKNELRESFLFTLMIAVGGGELGIGLLKSQNWLGSLPYLGLVLLIGMAIANASVYWQSLLQRHTPNQIAGRVFSLAAMIGNASLPVAYGVYGLLLNRFSIAALMLLTGVGLAGVSLALLALYRRGSHHNEG